MDDKFREIVIDIGIFNVSMSHDDFEYLLLSALNHEDQFIENLYVSLKRVKEKQDEKTGKG